VFELAWGAYAALSSRDPCYNGEKKKKGTKYEQKKKKVFSFSPFWTRDCAFDDNGRLSQIINRNS